MALSQSAPGTGKVLATLDGTKYAYIYSKAVATKPTFLLLHGFPSSSYDWRHQIKSLSELGYGVIAPDLLGYGDTDKPTDLERYKLKKMSADVAQILDEESLEKVIGVGHDWGSGILSRLTDYYPERFSGFIFTSVTYMEPGPFDLDAMNAMSENAFGYPTFGYWYFFNEDGAAEICDKNNASFTSLVYPQTPELWKTSLGPRGAAKAWVTSNTIKPLPDWLPESEAAHHNEVFAKGGYTGPLSWYKAMLRGLNIEDDAQISDEKRFINSPTLVIVSDEDAVTRAEVSEQLSPIRLRNFALKKIIGAGHWIPLEKKDEYLELLTKFAAVIEGNGQLGDI